MQCVCYYSKRSVPRSRCGREKTWLGSVSGILHLSAGLRRAEPGEEWRLDQGTPVGMGCAGRDRDGGGREWEVGEGSQHNIS